LNQDDQLWEGLTVLVKSGSDGLKNSYWELRTGTPTLETSWSSRNSNTQYTASRHGPFIVDRSAFPGNWKPADQRGRRQEARATLARIMPSAMRDLLRAAGAGGLPGAWHGQGRVGGAARPARQGTAARAPGDPSLTGLSAADFQFTDNLKVWSYDRPTTPWHGVQTGMFEQMLLDNVLRRRRRRRRGAPSRRRVSGARVSGARVSGAGSRGTPVGADAADGPSRPGPIAARPSSTRPKVLDIGIVPIRLNRAPTLDAEVGVRLQHLLGMLPGLSNSPYAHSSRQEPAPFVGFSCCARCVPPRQ